MIFFIAALGVLFILIGLKGFTPTGIPWSATTQIKGQAGKTVGYICISVGCAIFAIVIWIGVKIST